MQKMIAAYIDNHHDEILALLGRMVNIDSGSYTIDGIVKKTNILTEILSDIGFEVTTLPSQKYAPHLLAVKTGTGSKKIMFLGHMDTVFAEGTAAKRPFRIEGNKAYGPGVCDMQAGIVCLVYVVKALEFLGYHQYGELKILLNSDEERGSETSETYIIKECQKSDMVLVMEPGIPGNYVVIERQGGGIFHMDIWGKAAHAGASPLDGIHAIDEASHKIQALHSLTDYDAGKSISVGVIKGGTRSNIIPEHVFMEIDIRSRTNSDGQKLIRDMQAVSDTPYVPGTRSRLQQIMYRPPMEKTSGNQFLFEKLQQAAAQLNMAVKEKYCGGGSDGNYTSAQGIPTIDSLGPIGDLEHTDDEYLLIDSIFSRTKLVTCFILELTS